MGVFTDGTHLVAHTLEELHAFAEHIGLKRRWFQDQKPDHPHYDTLSGSIKQKAIACGAILITSREIVEKFQNFELERLDGLNFHKCLTCGRYFDIRNPEEAKVHGYAFISPYRLTPHSKCSPQNG